MTLSRQRGLQRLLILRRFRHKLPVRPSSGRRLHLKQANSYVTGWYDYLGSGPRPLPGFYVTEWMQTTAILDIHIMPVSEMYGSRSCLSCQDRQRGAEPCAKRRRCPSQLRRVCRCGQQRSERGDSCHFSGCQRRPLQASR